MILLIVGLYAAIAGKIHITRNRGLRGAGARVAGLVCIAFAIGFFSILNIPVELIGLEIGADAAIVAVVGLTLQLLLLFLVLSYLIRLFGNAYGATPEPMRWTSRIFIFASLALCLAAITLWVHGRGAFDSISCDRLAPQRSWDFTSSRGRVFISGDVQKEVNSPGWSVRSGDAADVGFVGLESYDNGHGFFLQYPKIRYPDFHAAIGDPPGVYVGFPMWAATFAFALLTAACVLASREGRSLAGRIARIRSARPIATG